jgi:hypothetical protein
MFWRSHPNPDPRARAFCLIHERFLSRALRSASLLPRIPLRRVDRGGFDSLRSRPAGRAACDRWWASAFDRLDRVDS